MDDSRIGPTLRYETELLARGHVIVGLDEVGRGAVAGPLVVGAVAISSDRAAPLKLDDSKRLTPKVRRGLVQPIVDWADDTAVGSASAREIDQWGLRHCLTLASLRALAQLHVRPTTALIDGSVNFLEPVREIYNFPDELYDLERFVLPATVIVKGDQVSATIAAASVIAKVARDSRMDELACDFPEFGWQENKGYLSESHAEALREFGVTEQHRRSWAIPGK